MKKSRFGVIVRVQNLDLCRYFYQAIIGLGDPIVNSSFWVEFKASEDSSLILEQCSSAEKVEPQNVSWKFLIPDIVTLKERLIDYGCETPLEVREFNGETLMGFRDPEGNYFYIESES